MRAIHEGKRRGQNKKAGQEGKGRREEQGKVDCNLYYCML
jgi:hypothetical protein